MNPNTRASPVEPEVVVNGAQDMVKSLRHSFSADSHPPSSLKLRGLRALSPTLIRTGYSDHSIDRREHSETQTGLQQDESSAKHIRARSGPSRSSLAISDLLSPDPSCEVVSGRQRQPFAQIHTDAAKAGSSCSILPSDYGNSAEVSHDRSVSCTQPHHHTLHDPQNPWHFREYNSHASIRYMPTFSESDDLHNSAATPGHPATPSHRSDSPEPPPTRSGASVYSPALPPTISQPPLTYTLSIRQQPIAARACGFGERDRRVVDPPPILELKISNEDTGAPEQDPNAMLAIHCTLVGVDSDDEEVEAETADNDIASSRRLMGTSVASPYQAKDEHGVAGTFFVFSDLSCRTPGRFRLRFKLLRVDPMLMIPGVRHGTVATVDTDVFSVYTAKDFPGMRASTTLLTALRGQGLNVGLKKGTEVRVSKSRKRKERESSEDGSKSESNGEPRVYSAWSPLGL